MLLLCGMLPATLESATAATTAVISVSVRLDATPPAVVMNSAAPNATNTAPIPVSVQFSEPVLDFVAGDVVISNATLNGFAGSGANYSFNLIPAIEGVVTADIAAGAARDLAGNLSAAAARFERIYDVTPPTGSLVINGDAVFTRDVSVNVGLTASDGTGSGVTAMALRNADTAWSAWETYLPSRAWALESGQGYKTIEARYRDAAGNISTVPIVDTIALDTEPLALAVMGPNPAYEPEHGSHVFVVDAVGLFGAPEYQWYKEDGASKALIQIAGATEPVYTRELLEVEDSGSYYCEATDETETALSPAAILIVQTGVPALGIAGTCAAAGAVALAGVLVIRRQRRALRRM